MQFGFTQEQNMFRDSVRRFIERECTTTEIRRLDENGEFPQNIVQKMASLGWYSAFTDKDNGGMGLSATYLAIMSEELARFSPCIAAAYYITMWGVLNINLYGSEEQKKNYLPKVNEGKQNFSFSITEPDSGSDASALSCKAELDKNEWFISGQKIFCTQAAAPNNTIILCARTNTNVKHEGISLFFVPNDSKGLTIKRMSTMSRRMLGTYELFFDNVRLPSHAILGEVDKGWSYIIGHLERERMCVAANSVGYAKQILNDIIQYVKQRHQFGQPLADFQVIQHTIADLKIQIDCAELLAYKVASMLEQEMPCSMQAAEAKLFCTETLVNTSMQGMRLLGGYGLTEEFGMVRAFREGMGAVTGGGTSNIQRNIIAKNIFRSQ